MAPLYLSRASPLMSPPPATQPSFLGLQPGKILTVLQRAEGHPPALPFLPLLPETHFPIIPIWEPRNVPSALLPKPVISSAWNPPSPYSGRLFMLSVLCDTLTTPAIVGSDFWLVTSREGRDHLCLLLQNACIWHLCLWMEWTNATCLIPKSNLITFRTVSLMRRT